jgi:long-chain acyl-CoA synthetase
MASHDVLAERDEILRLIEGRTLCDVLERNATIHGSRPALSSKEGDDWHTLTWRDVREQVADVALGLAEIGVGRGDFVAIMASNRPEHVIADQAAVHAGATPSTFYATLAPEQIRYVADDCSAKAAILENRDVMKRWLEVRDSLSSLEHVVLLEDAGEFEDVLSWDDLLTKGRAARAETPGRFDEMWRQVDPSDYATLIYTSGTTGPPKGVPITHANILYACETLDRVTGLPDHITGVSYLPLAHIAERVVSMYLGGSKAAHGFFCPDPSQVVEYVQEARPSSFFGVPRVWEKVRAGITAKIEAEENDTKRRLAQRALRIATAVVRLEQRGKHPSLLLRAEHAALDRVVLAKIRGAIGLDRCEFASSSAAPLPIDVAEFFAALGLPLLEAWGMTELTGAATLNPPGRVKIGTVGPPLPGIEVTVAAEDGEVLVRGPIAVDGYFNLPDATAELIGGDGWLHTGDVGEIDENGYLRIVDRKKELIITAGGKNISPSNIEAHLKEHPLIGQALAFGDNKPYVTALIVLDHEVIPGWAEQQGLETTDIAALAEHPKVLEEIGQAVQRANERLSRAEQVKKFDILPAEWTPESEELTPTLKLRRRIIHDKYAERIESLYAG